jgi:MraZ protein
LAFRGTFEYTLDAKNRLTVPAKFRAQLADGVVLAKGIEPCVSLWTPDAYDAFVEQVLAGRNPASPQARQLQRFYAANAADIELDAAGRVMVPSFLIEYASLSREVVITGAGDSLEIWDRASWHAENAALADRVNEITAALDHPV